MGKMQEFYEKVAGDASLQEKFGEIMNSAEKSGADETKGKLLSFAKDAGYDITIAEMQEFFQGLAEQNQDELSDSELDMVAGGKLSTGDWGSIAGGVLFVASAAAGFTAVGVPVAIGCMTAAAAAKTVTS